MLPNGPGGVVTVHAGHLHVHQNQIEGLVAVEVHRFLAVGGRGDVMFAVKQQSSQQFQVLWHIIGNQNAQGWQRDFLVCQRILVHGQAGRQGQFYLENRALTRAAGHADGATHQFHQLSGNGRAQASATKATGHAGIGLGKRFENPVDAIGRNANAGILNPDNDLVHRGLLHLQGDAACLGEFYGIA